MLLKQNGCLPTVNFHFTNKCNMNCKYCFVPSIKQLSLDEDLTLIENLKPYFSRINFVGGEPTSSSNLIPLLQKAKSLGFITSIVTNGYNLIYNKINVDEVIALTDMIGISVDSIKEFTNKKIGRYVREGKNQNVICTKKLVELCKKIKKSGTKLKINTVISKANISEDFTDFYNEIYPDRIKIFQCLKPNNPLKNNYDDILISSADFKNYLKKYDGCSFKIISEDNNEMTSSYYMLGSDGCFWDNYTGIKSQSLVSVSVEEALQSIVINDKKYERRYA